MTVRPRESSSETASRFLASRGDKDLRRARRKQKLLKKRELQRQLSRLPAAPPAGPPRRIIVDLAEPTLRLIHDVLLDALHAGIHFSDRDALLMIAEQMVATALGDPPCDDPPLTDRKVM